MRHISVCGGLNECHSGLRMFYNTTTSMINLTEYIRERVDKRHVVVLLPLDFSRACSFIKSYVIGGCVWLLMMSLLILFGVILLCLKVQSLDCLVYIVHDFPGILRLFIPHMYDNDVQLVGFASRNYTI